MNQERKSKKDYGKHKIEPRIKPLVDILNDVSYIKTSSSCQGHFDKKDERDKAYVLFEVDGLYQGELMVLVKRILSEFQPIIFQVSAQLLQRYQVLNNQMETDYRLEIIPFKYDQHGEISPEENRKNTDKGIERAVSAVREYLEGIRE